jgi:hypothetical protein
LVAVKVGITIYQDLLNQEVRKGSKHRELTYRPPLPVKVAGKGVVEIPALVVETVIIGNFAKRPPASSVELISDEETANASLSKNRECSKDEDCYSPQTNWVFV